MRPGPEPPGAATAHETHLSWITLLGDRAYKLLKPVDLGFVDHRRREARREALLREAEVNRRFAPDVYLGVLDVREGDDAPCDHLLAMRRMPAGRCLTVLLEGDGAHGHVTAVADAIARIHADSPTGAAVATAGEPARRLADWRDNLEQLEAHAPGIIDPADAARAVARAQEYLAGRGPLLHRRIAEGWVRDGHGDLLADDTYCLDDGPRFLDCLAFDDRLRAGDVLADVAFLAMDVEHRGHPALAAALLERWSATLGERHPATLAHQHIAYRAHVRAKVTAMRAAGGDDAAASTARDLHALALRHLEAGRMRIVLVGGTPGTGKSTLAAALSRATGWPVLRTDALRPAVVGPAAHDPGAGYGTGRYSEEERARVYREMLDRARTPLALGEPVILDASWGRADDRAAARGVAAEAGAAVVELRCVAPPAVADARIAARRPGDDPSEATPAVAAALRAAADPWPQAVEVPTDRPLEETVRIALGAVGPR